MSRRLLITRSKPTWTRSSVHIASGLALASLTVTALPATNASAQPPRLGKAATVEGSTQGCASDATQLTFWAWVPDIQRSVSLFNATHPGICVHLDDVGAATSEYEKLEAALKAGSGAPDVVQLQGVSAQEFYSSKELVNLNTYHAESLKSEFYSFAWDRLQQGGATYCIPQDIGPMGMIYNTAFFSKYHITVPTTWAQFAADARKVHSENPKAYLTDFPLNDGNWFFGLMGQSGAYQFGPLKGSTLPIHMDTAAAKSFAAYWQPLISKKIVDTIPDGDTAFYRTMGDGTIGVWPAGAWGPDDFTAALAGPSVGKWRVAPLPQWKAGQDLQADYGGACDAVTQQSKDPKAAYEFDDWLNTSTASWKLMVQAPTDLYPSLPKIADSAFFTDTTLPLTGSQKFYKIFDQAAAHLSSKQIGSPIEIYVFTEFADDTSSGKPLSAVLDEVQSQSVGYARQVGLTPTQ